MESQKSRRKPEIRHHLVDEIVIIVCKRRIVLVRANGNLLCRGRSNVYQLTEQHVTACRAHTHWSGTMARTLHAGQELGRYVTDTLSAVSPRVNSDCPHTFPDCLDRWNCVRHSQIDQRGVSR